MAEILARNRYNHMVGARNPKIPDYSHMVGQEILKSQISHYNFPEILRNPFGTRNPSPEILEKDEKSFWKVTIIMKKDEKSF